MYFVNFPALVSRTIWYMLYNASLYVITNVNVENAELLLGSECTYTNVLFAFIGEEMFIGNTFS